MLTGLSDGVEDSKPFAHGGNPRDLICALRNSMLRSRLGRTLAWAMDIADQLPSAQHQCL